MNFMRMCTTETNKSTNSISKGKLNMDLSNISKDTPIEPEIELDGGYAYCVRCTNEIDPHNKICPYCHQTQDWSWFGKYTKNK